jgi:hypothetical protein
VKGIEYVPPGSGEKEALSIGDFGLPGIHNNGFYRDNGHRDIEFCASSNKSKYLYFPKLEYRVVDNSTYLAFPRDFTTSIRERGHWRQYDKSREAFHTQPYDAYDPPDTEWEASEKPALKLNDRDCWRVGGCDFLKVPSWIEAKPPKGSVAGKVDAFVRFALFPRNSEIADPQPAIFSIIELVGRSEGTPTWVDSGRGDAPRAESF